MKSLFLILIGIFLTTLVLFPSSILARNLAADEVPNGQNDQQPISKGTDGDSGRPLKPPCGKTKPGSPYCNDPKPKCDKHRRINCHDDGTTEIPQVQISDPKPKVTIGAGKPNKPVGPCGLKPCQPKKKPCNPRYSKGCQP
uniref:Uncharacterized protein n=2 Tax=Cannabis sativa TaxID=3483 RepID=A0A803QKD6_CANSA